MFKSLFLVRVFVGSVVSNTIDEVACSGVSNNLDEVAVILYKCFIGSKLL